MSELKEQNLTGLLEIYSISGLVQIFYLLDFYCKFSTG